MPMSNYLSIPQHPPRDTLSPTPGKDLITPLQCPPATSPILPLFGGTNNRERRPLVATSAASTGSWEGTSDIYDDYRYSRFSMASEMSMSSRFSVNTGATGGVASGVSNPPVPELRPSMGSNSNGSRQRVDSMRSRGENRYAQGRIRRRRGSIRLI